MSTKSQLLQELDNLNEDEIKQVAEYVSFLKFRARLKTIKVPDESELEALYAEFADEDRELAEQGMEDYLRRLLEEDNR